MSLFRIIFIATSLVAINPLDAMLQVNKFNGPKKNQVSKNRLALSMPYDEQRPDENTVKNPSQERWEKKAKHIEFTQSSPDGIQKRIISHLFPASARFGNEIAAAKFLTMDPLEAARHMERADILTQNPKTHMPIEIPFLLEKQQQQMLQKMNLHFLDENVTNIPVTRKGWAIIQSLPEDSKCEYKNKKEFYTAQLMRDSTDQVVYVTSQAIQGGLKGAVPGFVAGYVRSGISLLQNASPEFAKKTFEETNSESMTHFGDSLQQGLNQANNWLQQQTDSLEEQSNVNLKYGLQAFKKTREAIVDDYIETIKDIAKKEASNTAKELCTSAENLTNPETLSTTMQSVRIGMGLGIVNGLLTMNDPIQKESISKI